MQDRWHLVPLLAYCYTLVCATTSLEVLDETTTSRRQRRKAATTTTTKKTKKDTVGSTSSGTGRDDNDDDDLLVCRNLHLDEIIFRAPSLPGPAPYRSRFVTEEIFIGGGGGGQSSGSGSPKKGIKENSSSDDTDVTFLLLRPITDHHGGGGGDKVGDNDRFEPSPHLQFRLRFATNYPREVKLLKVDYTTNGAGVQLGSAPGPALDNTAMNDTLTSTTGMNDCFFEESEKWCFVDMVLLIPHDSYINPARATWGNMRRIAMTYGLEGGGTSTTSTSNKVQQQGGLLQNVEVRLQKIRLCTTQIAPNFCSELSVDEYDINGHDCNCETCHPCGCTAAPPWASDCDDNTNNGQCGSDQGGCWCGVACKCCSDCLGYSCNCQTCFDKTRLTGCALGSTISVDGVKPSDGISTSTNEVVVSGKLFFANAPDLTCRFSPIVSSTGENDGSEVPIQQAGGVVVLEVPGGYRSPSEVFCSIPPFVLPNGTAELVTSVSVSMDGKVFSDPNPEATFTYYNCPDGCNNNKDEHDDCPASSCSCPPEMYGPDCSLQCKDCEHGRCGAVTGTCMCSKGWAGVKCDLHCPGGTSSPCTGRGTCYATAQGGGGGGRGLFEEEGEASCYCSLGYWGPACENKCPRDTNNHVCGGKNRGSCDHRDGTCSCNDGYYGSACSHKCPGLGHSTGGVSCSGHGICCTGNSTASYSQCQLAHVGSCACDAGRAGVACEEAACFNECYGHGLCTSNGTCVCADGYEGVYCSLLTGQDASIAYISFADSAYTVTEEQGFIAATVVRSGSLTERLSVHVETRDLSATAGEDYVALSNRLEWSRLDGTPKSIEVSVLPNDWPEGQESFELVLSDTVPASSVVGTGLAVIRIAAKEEVPNVDVSKAGKDSLIAARITVRVSRPWDLVKPGTIAGEEMRTALRDAAATSLSVNRNRIYLKGNSDIRPTEFGRVLITFDILPPLATASGAAGSKGPKDAANDFVKAVAEQSSALYGRGMDVTCPIDTTFMPEILLFALDGSDIDSSRSSFSVSKIIVVSMFLMALVATVYTKREQLMEVLLQWLSRRKFQILSRTGDQFDGGGFSEPGFSEFAVARSESGGLQEGLKRKVLQIELT